MEKEKNYQAINRASWNKKTDIHYESSFYDNDNFIKGASSLKEIELALLPDLKGKKVLHLQCHFGQDTISLNRLGADAVGMDLSDRAIEKAGELAKITKSTARFVCCDIYDLPNHLDEKFDIVFTSYGTIGWLPDLKKWSKVITHFLKPGGQFIFAEFHPVVWMFDDDFTKVQYDYSNTGPIIETYEGTYADQKADLSQDYVMWNHGIGEVLSNLIDQGLTIQSFQEYDYSPYACFKETIEYEKGKFRIPNLKGKIPMVYSLVANY